MVQSEEGESQAEVIWKILERHPIAHSGYGVAARQIDPSGEEGGQVLSFTSSSDCLGFANAFYGMTNDRPRGDVPSVSTRTLTLLPRVLKLPTT
jgi:hypothetical protein